METTGSSNPLILFLCCYLLKLFCLGKQNIFHKEAFNLWFQCDLDSGSRLRIV